MQPGARGSDFTRPEKPEKYEKPEGRILIYWGCSEAVRPGQPVILDMAKAGGAQFAKAMAGRTPTPQYPPARGKDRTYGDWPNCKDYKEVPKESSLVGEHFIHGNYTPDIRFPIGAQQDFMAQVVFSGVKGSLAESIRFEWAAIPTAIGYFATAIGGNQKANETIFWSSSEVQEIGTGLMDYLPNQDVRRFIKEKVIMPPETTQCAIPKGIFKDTGGTMLRFIGYGEELNLAHPPKPQDPKQPWNPIWTAKVRLKSTGMLMLGGEAAHAQQPAAETRKPQRDEASEAKEKPGALEQLPEPVKKLKGLFGF